jgi:hypothetical protein
MTTLGICPSMPSEWLNTATARKVGSIHDFITHSSASKIDVDQFLALKVLWKIEPDINALKNEPWAKRLGTTSQEISSVRVGLRQHPTWREYEKALSEPSQPPTAPISDKLGPFMSVLQNQRIVQHLNVSEEDQQKVLGSPMVTRSGKRLGEIQPVPMKSWGPGLKPKPVVPQSRQASPAGKEGSRGSNPESDISVPSSDVSILSDYYFNLPKAQRAAMADEQVVNTAAISFLQSVSIDRLNRNSFWSPQRKGFRFGNTRFRAFTDGHLQILGQARSAAILEVKARKRPTKKARDYKIEWQESAQMALWIRDEPSSYWTAGEDSTICR